MSKSRHPQCQMRSYAISHPPGVVDLPTQAGWDRLVFAPTGLFTAHTTAHAWTIPAHRALCVPDGIPLKIETPRRVSIRCLYATTDLAVFGDGVRVLTLNALSRELVTYAIERAPLDTRTAANGAVAILLAEQLTSAPAAPLHLPYPVDIEARALATMIRREPGTPLSEHLRGSAATRRTLERRFKSETQLSLGHWHRRARVLASVAWLADGDNVTGAAMKAGYASPSSFVVAFRAELHSTPRQFMSSVAA